jgi:flagellin
MEEDMSFMIGPNETGLRVYNHVNTHQIAQANQLARVASGKEASGDGTGAASLSTLADRSATVELTRVDILNAQQALGQLNVMDAALTEMAAIAQNGMEASNKTGYLAAHGTAFGAAIDEIDANAQFNGSAAIAASTAVVGAVGGGMNFGVAVDATSAGESNIFGGVAHNALDSDAFEAAVDALAVARATVAANIQQVQGIIQSLNATLTNELAAKSQIENNDLAVEMMNLTASQVMVQAASAMLAQAMNTGTEVLRLLNN